jgi:hypothetical protein
MLRRRMKVLAIALLLASIAPIFVRIARHGSEFNSAEHTRTRLNNDSRSLVSCTDFTGGSPHLREGWAYRKTDHTGPN